MNFTDGSTMPQHPTTAGVWRARTLRVVCLLAFAGALAGCDRCGDFWSPTRSQDQTGLQSCKDEAPRPQ